MADQSQKTEKPTQKRQEKAREEGQYPSARQFLSGIQFCLCVYLIDSRGAEWLDGLKLSASILMKRAFGPQITSGEMIQLGLDLAWRTLFPLLIGGCVLVVATLALQLGITRMGFTLKKLAPDLTRLNPVTHLKQIPENNFPAFIQALIMLPLFAGAVWAVAVGELDTFVALPLAPVDSAVRHVGASLLSLLWKGAGLFFVFGCVDLFRQLRKHSSQLRMSKQEIKDEAKESDGNPHIKARMRSLRRSLAQRRMMQNVPTATAVVVNPTHYAVALRYVPESMAAPLVVAKGKNYLALRIRGLAESHGVPIIENKPLAQALYKSVDVGQEIPPQLYRVVAEVLAYIFRMMNRR
jgi:flagellar biosynthetic protein FlhB